MKFDHSFKHHDVSQALMGYLEEKMQRLQKFEIKPGTAHVTYSSQRHRCLVEVNLMGGDQTFKAQAGEDDWYLSVDHVVQKLEVQMKKHKSQVKGHRNPEKSRRERLKLVNSELETEHARIEQTALHKRVG